MKKSTIPVNHAPKDCNESACSLLLSTPGDWYPLLSKCFKKVALLNHKMELELYKQFIPQTAYYAQGQRGHESSFFYCYKYALYIPMSLYEKLNKIYFNS